MKLNNFIIFLVNEFDNMNKVIVYKCLRLIAYIRVVFFLVQSRWDVTQRSNTQSLETHHAAFDRGDLEPK